MKALTRLLFLLAVGEALAGCATTQKVTGPIVATVKDCADKVTHSVELGILDDVSAALVCSATSGESLPACVIAELGAVAKNAGWSAIDCALADIQAKAASNATASFDATEKLRADRATAAIAWRATQPQ